MTSVLPRLTDDERRRLVAHYSFYRSLESGERVPTTAAQWHFVAVCRGAATPETVHEVAFEKFKRIVAGSERSEAAIVASGFLASETRQAASACEVLLDSVEMAGVAVRPCLGCNRPILPERLEALPDATLCVDCQRGEESARAVWRVSGAECPCCAERGVKALMVWRTARDPTIPGYFFGCSRFPECRHIDRDKNGYLLAGSGATGSPLPVSPPAGPTLVADCQ